MQAQQPGVHHEIGGDVQLAGKHRGGAAHGQRRTVSGKQRTARNEHQRLGARHPRPGVGRGQQIGHAARVHPARDQPVRRQNGKYQRQKQQQKAVQVVDEEPAQRAAARLHAHHIHELRHGRHDLVQCGVELGVEHGCDHGHIQRKHGRKNHPCFPQRSCAAPEKHTVHQLCASFP